MRQSLNINYALITFIRQNKLPVKDSWGASLVYFLFFYPMQLQWVNEGWDFDFLQIKEKEKQSTFCWRIHRMRKIGKLGTLSIWVGDIWKDDTETIRSMMSPRLSDLWLHFPSSPSQVTAHVERYDPVTRCWPCIFGSIFSLLHRSESDILNDFQMDSQSDKHR